MENFALNHQLLLWLHPSLPVSSTVMFLYTFFAKYLILLFPLTLIYQCLRYKERRALVIVIFVALMIALGISEAIQYFFPTQRPFVDGVVTTLLPHAIDASFPSDHTLFAATIAFGFIFGRAYKLGYSLLILSVIIGISRISAGLHYPLDIAGGLVIAFISAAFCVKTMLPGLQRALLWHN